MPSITSADNRKNRNWMSLKSFPHYQQQEAADCGPSCLRMIAKYYGKVYFHSQNIYCRSSRSVCSLSLAWLSAASFSLYFLSSHKQWWTRELTVNIYCSVLNKVVSWQPYCVGWLPYCVSWHNKEVIKRKHTPLHCLFFRCHVVTLSHFEHN